MRIAVVGLGRMGRRHIQAVRSLGHDVCGISDISTESLELTEREHDIGPDRHFRTLSAMLAATRPDALIVATTAPTHAPYTCEAAEAGVRHIVCEKPMAISLAECDRMIAACRTHGARLAINHQMRFMEQYIEPKAIAESEGFGGLRSVTVVAGNFGLSMNALHYFEMFRFVTGERPRTVTAWLADDSVPNPRGPQFSDRAGSVRVETGTGRRFYLDCWSDQGHGVQAVYAGPFGQIHIDELQGTMHVALREAEYRDLPSTRYGMPAVRIDRAIAPADVIGPSAAVLRAVVDGHDYPSGEDGRLAVSVLVGAYLSHERGHQPVDLERDDLPLDRAFPWA